MTTSSRLLGATLSLSIALGLAACDASTSREPDSSDGLVGPTAAQGPPSCPGHPSCKDDDGGDDSGGTTVDAILNLTGPPISATDEPAFRKEKGRTLEYTIPADDAFEADLAFDLTGPCRTSGDVGGVITEAELRDILSAGTDIPVGDGGFFFAKRTSDPSDLNRVVLVWDPDSAVDGDFVARVPAEAELLDDIEAPSASIVDNGDGTRTVTVTGGVVRLTNRGAAQDWPVLECQNLDTVILQVDDTP